MPGSALVVLGYAAGAVLLGSVYFRRYAVTRPPIGVLNLADVAVLVVAVVGVPYLYLAAPRWLVAGLLALSVVGVLYLLCEPVLGSRWAVWLLVLALVGADVTATAAYGPTSSPARAVNNLVVLLAVVGVTNLWAQSGMKARDTVVLAGAVALYDLVATDLTPLTEGLLHRLAAIPLAPMVVWHSDGSRSGLGIGDLLFATVFPLVMRKAFGRSAGLAAVASVLAALGVVLALLGLGVGPTTFPTMLVLWPLLVVQYCYWRRRRAERTTWQYLQAEPLRVTRAGGAAHGQ